MKELFKSAEKLSVYCLSYEDAGTIYRACHIGSTVKHFNEAGRRAIFLDDLARLMGLPVAEEDLDDEKEIGP